MKKDPVFRKKFKKGSVDSVSLLAGGRSRIRGHGYEVEEANEVLFDIVDRGKFWPLAQYKEEFGCPKKNNAKVMEVKRGNKLVKGVVVIPEDVDTKGPVDCAMTSRQRVTRSSKKHGGDVLSDDEMSEADEDAKASVVGKMAGALSLEETRKRAPHA